MTTTTSYFGRSKTTWDDLRFPVSAINPPGLASDPDVDNTNGYFLFDAAGTELVFLVAQLPHSYKPGSTLRPHLHWAKSTSAAGNVMWQLDYKWAKIGEVIDASFTTLSTTSAVAGTPDTNAAGKHLISSFGDISGAGAQLSDILVMKLSRIGGNAADTYGADAIMFEFDIHFESDISGSQNEYSRNDA